MILTFRVVVADPHFSTFDGTKYSYHGECDLIFARGTLSRSKTQIDVHARTTMIDGWSLISSAAIRIENDILEIVNDGSFYLNGLENTEITTMMSDRFNVTKNVQMIHVANDNGKEEQHSETTFKIELDDEQDITITIWMTMIAVSVNAYLTGSEGMLGVHGKIGMVGRDHTTIFDDANLMGAEWQVRDTEAMLFHDERAPQYPMECKLATPQSRRRRLRDNEHLMKQAKVTCAGVDEDMVAFCIEDVLLTGNKNVAIGYAARF
jgi:von Willebrand factor type D domain